MQFYTILALATAAIAMPAAAPISGLEARQAPVCGSGNAQCCATDVLGVADLDCANPTFAFTTGQEFVDGCAAIGQRARCCLIPIVSTIARLQLLSNTNASIARPSSSLPVPSRCHQQGVDQPP